jgi:hypothetical protein
MKLKRFDELNEKMEDYNPNKDYYPNVTKIEKEITSELEDRITSMNLKKDEEYNLYVGICQWAEKRKREVDGSYWTSNQPG